MSQTHNSIVLNFVPPLQCRGPECGRMTSVGIAAISSDDISLYPVCETHGYAGECGPEQEQASIIRFLLAEHDNKGSAQYLSTCPLDSVPGFEQENGAQFDTLAWACYWIDEQGIGHRQYVTWEADYLAFTLYEEEERATQ